MTTAHQTHAPLLISFSGLDGAGKSTQIDNLRALLTSRGLSHRLLAFWDHVVVLSRYREGFVHKVFKSERGIGAPGKPVNRRDKNVRGWHVNFARHGLYLLDALNLRRVIARARQGGEVPDVIIMDRYIHDELANLPLDNALTRAFVRFVAALAPRPDLAYMLDADPDAARARKPEYPLEFLRDSRQRYHRLATIVPMAVIPPLPLEEATTAVEQAFVKAWKERGGAAVPSSPDAQTSAA
jgi:thymidylate kinase